MSITNIGTLQTAVESWMERTIDDSLFLEWANSVADELNHGVMAPDGRTWIVPPVRIRSMLTATTLSTSSAVATIPAAVLEFERIWINATDGTGKDLEYRPLRQWREDPDVLQSGTPTKYTIDGSSLYVAPTSDATLQVSYYGKLGAFSGDASYDAVLTNHYRVYLHGCLSEACAWVGDYEREAREDAKFAAAAKALNGHDRQMSTSGSILVARPQMVS